MAQTLLMKASEKTEKKKQLNPSYNNRSGEEYSNQTISVCAFKKDKVITRVFDGVVRVNLR